MQSFSIGTSYALATAKKLSYYYPGDAIGVSAIFTTSASTTTDAQDRFLKFNSIYCVDSVQIIEHYKVNWQK